MNSRLTKVAATGGLVFAVGSAWGLELWKSDYVLPDNVLNGIVNINTKGGFFGTGTIVGVRMDDSANANGGAWIVVLTADHVLLNDDGSGLDSPFDIGLKDGNNFEYQTTAVIRGPMNNDNTRVDIGMLGFKVANYTNFLGQLRKPTAGLKLPEVTTAAQLTTLELAGSGYTNEVPVNAAKYKQKVETGTLRVGTALADEVGVEKSITFFGNNYKFSALVGKLRFNSNGDGSVASGSAYTREGDSGGATYFSNGGNYSLVGVHSSSLAPDTSGFNYADDTWRDVYISQYTTWMQNSIAAVPEPTSMCALGILALAIRPRRARK